MSSKSDIKSNGEWLRSCRDKRNSLYYDHLGNVYDFLDDMCYAYGIKKATFRYRRRNGWDLERALTEQISHCYRRGRCEDHLGTVYANFKTMCESYGVPDWLVQIRMLEGYDLEYSLTHALKRKDSGESLLAVSNFESIDDICNYYCLTSQTLIKRLKKGISLRDALLENTGYSSRLATKDYRGVEFRSFAEMCRYYGKEVGTVSYRLSQGYSLKDALTKTDCRYLGSRKKDLDALNTDEEVEQEEDIKNHPLYDWLFN